VEILVNKLAKRIASAKDVLERCASQISGIMKEGNVKEEDLSNNKEDSTNLIDAKNNNNKKERFMESSVHLKEDLNDLTSIKNNHLNQAATYNCQTPPVQQQPSSPSAEAAQEAINRMEACKITEKETEAFMVALRTEDEIFKSHTLTGNFK
jgi:hypothetical protein